MKKTIYYKNGLCGGTNEDRNRFYDTLGKIKKQAISSDVKIGNFYDTYTYNFKNMTVSYVVDIENGIPESITFIGGERK